MRFFFGKGFPESLPRMLIEYGRSTRARGWMLVLLPKGPGRPPEPRRPSRISYKGGELSLALVRARGDQILHDPVTFAPGDRFKVLVTCPPAGPALHWELAIYQDGAASFPLPLPQQGSLPTGNREPLPGAFTLSGHSPASVCLLVSEKPLSRAELGRPDALHRQHLEAVCARLEPSPW